MDFSDILLRQCGPFYLWGIPHVVREYNLFDVEEKLGSTFPFRRLVREGAIIAGGAVRDWLLASMGYEAPGEDALAEQLASLIGGEPCEATDIDVYFRNEELAWDFYDWLLDNGAKVIREKNYVTDLLFEGSVVQLIRFAYYSPLSLISTFDFTVCQFAVAREGPDIRFYAGGSSLEDLKQRTVRIHCISRPLATMRRLLKYARKGFDVPDETLLIVARAVAEAEQAGSNSYDGEE